MATVFVFPGFAPSGLPANEDKPAVHGSSKCGEGENLSSDCFHSVVQQSLAMEPPVSQKKPKKIKKVIGHIRSACLNCFCIAPSPVEAAGGDNGGSAGGTVSTKDARALTTPPSSMHWSSTGGDGVLDSKGQELVSEEEFYSAQSDLEELFGQGHIESGGMTLVQMKVLDGRAPAIVPPAAMSTSLSLVLAVPETVAGAVGDWRKSIAESTPVPGQADKVVGAPFLVQRVRNKLVDIQIKESADEFTVIFKVPVAGMAPWVESYKKDGSLVEIKNRRDYRSGRACGQAMALANGVILLRVWNLGSLPEVMWEESFDFGTENKLQIDHRVFTLDGKKQGRQMSIGYRQSIHN